RESPHRKRGGEDVLQGLRMEDGKYRVDGLDPLADLCGDGAGIELSTKEDGQVFGGALVGAKVDLRNCHVRQRLRAGIRNHADDRGPSWLGSAQQTAGIQGQTDAFGKRVLIWPVGASRSLIDYRNLGR